MTFDAHTHTLKENALVCIDPTDREFDPVAPYLYSAGIHPWRVAEADDEALERLVALAASPRVIAIGETGLDTVHDGCENQLEAQTELLRRHIELSEKQGMPLVLHVVRRFNEIMALHRELKPRQAWVIHGFRGKPELARQLLREGFYLSYGERANPASVAVTPPDRLLVETDESSLSVGDIAAMLGVAPQARQLGPFDGRPLENP